MNKRAITRARLCASALLMLLLLTSALSSFALFRCGDGKTRTACCCPAAQDDGPPISQLRKAGCCEIHDVLVDRMSSDLPPAERSAKLSLIALEAASESIDTAAPLPLRVRHLETVRLRTRGPPILLFGVRLLV